MSSIIFEDSTCLLRSAVSDAKSNAYHMELSRRAERQRDANPNLKR
jgi:hypothetical protein